MNALAILLFYNDEDIVAEAIEHMLENNHQILVWDHSSTDNTRSILDKYKKNFIELKSIPRGLCLELVFRKISPYIIKRYSKKFDWISWPDSDEFLEGPSREKSYYEHLVDIFNSEYDWIEFNNFIYWFTEKDDTGIKSPTERVRYYSFKNAHIRIIRSWRASKMNVRFFNHNPTRGRKYPEKFNLRHYQMRSLEQMHERILKRTLGVSDGKINYHFDFMRKVLDRLIITSGQLNCDDGKSELSLDEKFDWNKIYGTYDEFLKMADIEVADWQTVEDKFKEIKKQ